MACPNPADHTRIKSLEMQVAALKAQLRASERREADLAEKLSQVQAPEPLRNAYKASPVSEKDEEMRLMRGFSDNDLGICLRVLHCIVMQPKLIPEFSKTLSIAKGLFEVPTPMQYIRLNKPTKPRPPTKRVLKEADRIKRFRYCKMQRDFMRELVKVRAQLPDLVKKGAVKLDDETSAFLERTDNLIKKVQATSDNDPFLRLRTQCWSCKGTYNVLHPVYEKLCHGCAQLNVEKRLAYTDLSGRVAIVTGGRVRIGFHVTTSLLRMGATVVVTTRFPVNAILELSKLADFDTWKDRLIVYGLDLRSPMAVERFTSDITARFPKIHILINNAAQTIAKPPGFYSHLIQLEEQGHDALPPALRPLLMHDNRTLAVTYLSPSHSAADADAAATTTGTTLLTPQSPSAASLDSETLEPIERIEPPRATKSVTRTTTSLIGLSLPVTHVDPSEDSASLPIRWAEGDQIDLRSSNTWVKELTEVSTEELVEVQAVNVIAPFVLVRNLYPVLEQTPGPKFVVNVSAMEGQFYRWKSSAHPHTNMAKAALNMMTRTLGMSFAVANINITAVDTGWVTDENTLPVQAKRAHPFVPPLSVEDGAARILDPIIMGMNGEPLSGGVFYKDFKQTYW